jgi:chemotaxis protein MotB
MWFKKKIAALEAQNKECQDLLNSTTMKLNFVYLKKKRLATK